MNNFAQLIESGLRLVPIAYGQKTPVHSGWNRSEAVIGDVSKVYCLDGKNIGLAHAYCQPSPTCAIDLDDFNESQSWFVENGISIIELLENENAVSIWSGKSNSRKLLYRLPSGRGPMITKTVINANGKTTFEFRCGTKNGLTVQDLIPPSRHPSGSDYIWTGRGNPLDIPIIPSKLLEIWSSLENHRSDQPVLSRSISDSEQPHVGINHKKAETPRAVAEVRLMLSHINANCDYCTWRNIVWGVLSTGWHSAIPLAREWSASSFESYSESKFNELVRSFDTHLKSCPTLGTVLFHARRGGWRG